LRPPTTAGFEPANQRHSTAGKNKPQSFSTLAAMSRIKQHGALVDVLTDGSVLIKPAPGQATVIDSDLTVTGDASVLGDVTEIITEAELSLSDNATNNSSSTKHGFLKKLSNVATEVLDGQHNFRTIAAILGFTPANAASVPVKATGAEVDTGTDDAKFVTAKALEDSDYIKAADLPAGGEFIAPRLLSSTVVDLNEGTAAKQALYTCPAGRRCVITEIVAQKASANPGGFAGSMGWNALADDVVLGNEVFGAGQWSSTTKHLLLTAFVTGGGAIPMNPVTGAAGEVLGLKISTPEGSALTCRVDVFGYLTDAAGVPVAGIA
jgi:hypothetical protein